VASGTQRKRLLPVVKLSEIRHLITRVWFKDGMIPKLLSCARTLRHNVGEVDILSTTASNVLLDAVKGGKNRRDPDVKS